MEYKINENGITREMTEEEIAELEQIDTEIPTISDDSGGVKADAIICSASGESIHIEDASDKRIVSQSIQGKSTQFTTTGAQLLDFTRAKGGTSNGITVTINDDGSYTMTGKTQDGATASAVNVWLLGGYNSTKPLFTLPAGTYTKSGVMLFNYHTGVGPQQDATFTLTEDTPVTAVRAVPVALGADINKTIFPMLNKGDTLLPWEPYTGGLPSPNLDYPQEIESVGNNGNIKETIEGAQLLNMLDALHSTKEYEGVTYTFLEGGTYRRVGTATGVAGNCWFKGGYKIKPLEDKSNVVIHLCAGKTYKIVDCVLSGYAGDKFKGFKGKVTISTESCPNGVDITGVRNLDQEVGKNYNDIVYPMVSFGETFLPWEPYKSQQIYLSTPDGLHGIPVSSGGNCTDENDQQWVCDTIEKHADGTGKRIQRVYKYVFDGTENIVLHASGKFYYSIANNLFIPGVCLCTHLIENNTSENGYYIHNDATGIYFNKNDKYATVEELKEFLASQHNNETPVRVLIGYAEPIETSLTAEELAELKNLHTFKPITNITTDSDAGIEVEYVTDTKIYIDNKFSELATALVAQ